MRWQSDCFISKLPLPREPLDGVTLNHVVFRDSAYLGRMYEVGLGLFTYIFGIFEGGLEVK